MNKVDIISIISVISNLIIIMIVFISHIRFNKKCKNVEEKQFLFENAKTDIDYLRKKTEEQVKEQEKQLENFFKEMEENIKKYGIPEWLVRGGKGNIVLPTLIDKNTKEVK